MLRPQRSRRPHKLRTGAKANSSLGQVAQIPHWIDVWLPRLSHFAQFGLFVLAIGGFYYTVLPLYQKAVLEEAIAKKEVELATATKALDHSYARIREYAVREFYIVATPQCTGLFFSRPNTSEAATEGVERRQSRAKFVYAIDVPSCLKQVADNTTALNELRPTDRKLFDAALKRLGVEIAELRKSSLAEYQTALSRITDADLKSLPSDSFRVRAQEHIEKWNGGKRDDSARRRLAEDIARENTLAKYEKAIREGIRALRKIQWMNVVESSK
jgi:hypothetical protein